MCGGFAAAVVKAVNTASVPASIMVLLARTMMARCAGFIAVRPARTVSFGYGRKEPGTSLLAEQLVLNAPAALLLHKVDCITGIPRDPYCDTSLLEL